MSVTTDPGVGCDGPEVCPALALISRIVGGEWRILEGSISIEGPCTPATSVKATLKEKIIRSWLLLATAGQAVYLMLSLVSRQAILQTWSLSVLGSMFILAFLSAPICYLFGAKYGNWALGLFLISLLFSLLWIIR